MEATSQDTEAPECIYRALPGCQAEGCEAVLEADKPYSMRKKLCSLHIRADVVVRRGQPKKEWRFCFQCGKLEPLSRFDGKQRSCRDRLEMRRRPKRDRCNNDNTDAAPPTKRKTRRKRDQDCSTVRTDMVAEPSSLDEQQQQQWQGATMCSPYQQDGSSPHGQANDVMGENSPDCSWPGPELCMAAGAVDFGADDQQQQLARTISGWEMPHMAGLLRTTTAVSGNVAAALLAEQQPAPTVAQLAAAPGAAVHPELDAAFAVQSCMTSLQQQCQQLRRQLQLQKQAMQKPCPAAVPPPQPVACLTGSGMLPVPMLAVPQAAPMMMPPAVLEGAGSLDSPCSLESDSTAMMALNQRELVELMVDQLQQDATTSAAAQELETMIELELLAAAAAPAEQGKHAWAFRLNHEINSLSSAISAAVMQPPAALSRSNSCHPASVTTPEAVAGAQVAARQGGLLAAQQYPAMSYGCQAPMACRPALPAVGPVPVFDTRLLSLQQQLVQLRGMIGDLQAQVAGSL